ncbi:hypothetical protein CspHIS471_0609440 [Cutaneotrichosporon sp. HIS471]|nr:hypothetical protein CspHIS471_0609440 [Cutaneotrichosporon sp. HIS471]
MEYFLSDKGGAPDDGIGTGAVLTWRNVGLGFLFIVFDAVLSTIMGLKIGRNLIVAACRCILQLMVMSLVLGKVFSSNNPYAVAGIAFLLNVLGAIEATFNKAKRRFSNMFPCILLSLLCGSIPIGCIGQRFAMEQHPFWQPEQFIPVLGMLLGNGISAIGIAMNAVSNEFANNRDRIETYLAFGAGRFEAVRPLAIDALASALLPTINQMSVIGLISIPGMMTGAIVGGKSVEQAAKLQMIVMFMISASSALATIVALWFALTTLIDNLDRVRPDRLDSRKPAFYRWRDRTIERVWRWCTSLWCCGGRKSGTEEERRGLLSGGEGGANSGNGNPNTR